MSFKIRYLADVPQAVPRLADYFRAEWRPYYGPSGPGDAAADIKACCQTDRLPLALVAIGHRGEIYGTGALKTTSVGAKPGQGPWIAALMVEKNNRRKGIGAALISALEGEARRRGFDALYTSTDTAGGILLRRQWRAMDQVASLRGPITVYRLSLRPGDLTGGK